MSVCLPPAYATCQEVIRQLEMSNLLVHYPTCYYSAQAAATLLPFVQAWIQARGTQILPGSRPVNHRVEKTLHFGLKTGIPGDSFRDYVLRVMPRFQGLLQPGPVISELRCELRFHGHNMPLELVLHYCSPQ